MRKQFAIKVIPIHTKGKLICFIKFSLFEYNIVFKSFVKKRGAKGRKVITGLYNFAKDQAPSLIANGQMKSLSEKLTMYSLYK